MECWWLFFGHSAYLIVAIWLTREDTRKPGLVFLFYSGDFAKASGKCLFLWIQTKPCCCPPHAGAEGWPGAVRCEMGSSRGGGQGHQGQFWSGSGQGSVCCWTQLFSLQPQICLTQSQRALGEKFSAWIQCSETWKLIFNNTVEMTLSCVARSGDQVLLVYTPGPCCWREVSMHGAGLGACLGVCFWRRSSVVI